jgi:4-amino-4-deoxy-L-arabinose transferase-like glycosyltransferase
LTNNNFTHSMLELAFGHNGLQRFVLPARALPRAPPSADPTQPDPTPPDPPGATQRLRSVDYVPAGVLRLAGPHLAAQVGWLFPLALIGGIAAWLRRARGSPARVQLALWGGWTAAYGIVFSAAGGFFHPHYLSLMAPPLCALAGIGLARLWSDFTAGRGGIWGLPLAVLATAAWQVHIVLGYFPDWRDGLAIGVAAIAALLAAGAVLAWRRPDRCLFAAGIAGSVLALLLAAPAAWALGATLASDNTGFASARPPFAATDETARLRWAARWGGFVHRPRLTEYLMRNRGEARFLAATLNARQAAPVIIDSGEPVLALGGFSGITPIVTVPALAEMVARGNIRFALIYRLQPGLVRQSPLADWIRRHGEPVDPASWRDEPDRPGATAAQARMDRGAARALELYDLQKAPPKPDVARALAAP